MTHDPSPPRPGADPAAAYDVEVIRDLARDLHTHPEVSGEERRSSARIVATLQEAGFTAAPAPPGLPTGFVAGAGTGPLVVALCVEYDALPGIGHACGHHLIAGAGVGAALEMHERLDELGLTVRVVGTPGAERGAGKDVLLRAGVFDDVAFALMVHFVPDGSSVDPRGTSSPAAGRFRAVYTGQGSSRRALSAANAAVVAQVAIGQLRHELGPDERVSLNIVTGGGPIGAEPDRCTVDFRCRAPLLDSYQSLVTRVRYCFEAGAVATGCTLAIDAREPLYEPMAQDDAVAEVWADTVAGLGYDVSAALPPVIATDMGNVSQRLPSIHPWVGIPGLHDPLQTAGFARGAIGEEALTTMADAARALARTVATIAADPQQAHRLTASAARRIPPSRRYALRSR